MRVRVQLRNEEMELHAGNHMRFELGEFGTVLHESGGDDERNIAQRVSDVGQKSAPVNLRRPTTSEVNEASQQVRRQSIHAEGPVLPLGSFDQSLKFPLVHWWQAHAQGVDTMSMMLDPTGLLTVGDDMFVRCWDLEVRRQSQTAHYTRHSPHIPIQHMKFLFTVGWGGWTPAQQNLKGGSPVTDWQSLVSCVVVCGL